MPAACSTPLFKRQLNVHILILNGPNLNLLGRREPDIYGQLSFEAYFQRLRQDYTQAQLHAYQSNHEGSLIDKIHEVGFRFAGIVLNAGGYTHTSVALADAVAAVTTPVVEVHISNLMEREKFRHHSYLKPVCVAHFMGIGLDGYRAGVDYLIKNYST